MRPDHSLLYVMRRRSVKNNMVGRNNSAPHSVAAQLTHPICINAQPVIWRLINCMENDWSLLHLLIVRKPENGVQVIQISDACNKIAEIETFIYNQDQSLGLTVKDRFQFVLIAKRGTIYSIDDFEYTMQADNFFTQTSSPNHHKNNFGQFKHDLPAQIKRLGIDIEPSAMPKLFFSA